MRLFASGSASAFPSPPPNPSPGTQIDLEKDREEDVENVGGRRAPSTKRMWMAPWEVRKSGSPHPGARLPLLRARGASRVAPLASASRPWLEDRTG